MAMQPSSPRRTLTGEFAKDKLFRILSLDGGGAKGFYTLGVLKEIEGMLGCPLYQCFDLIFGTSTGSIIGSLIALGYEIDEIHGLYRKYVPDVMKPARKHARSVALAKLARDVFGSATFEDVKTGIGVVATKWIIEKPIIFKGSVRQAHGRAATFVPGFGVPIGKAVQASCSAYPFFLRQKLKMPGGDKLEVVDGGYCANNPSLYAIADAVAALGKSDEDIRLVSVGVGVYPEPKGRWYWRVVRKYLLSVRLLQKTMEINPQSMEQLREVLFRKIKTVRISDSFNQPEMATDFMEYNLAKLDVLWQRGRDSFASRETVLREYLIPSGGS